MEFTLYEDGIATDVRRRKFGFRSVEIAPMDGKKGPFILLNGKPLKILGVNRHEFHPEYGHAVPRAVTEADIKLLKANNITSVRTSHYPNSRHFYELCDEYGILVMSECNLETHGLAKRIPRNDKVWLKHCLYRMENMVDSLKNHASIIFWSLGNESGNGSVFKKMREAALKIDATRPIHYEPDNTMKVSDVLSEMYAPLAKMPKIGQNKPIIHSRALWNLMLGHVFFGRKYKDKPFIQCEFAHAMGNSLGNFADYMAEFEKYDRLAGGYIWDFADQAILRLDSRGKKEYCCGGDFFDRPNDGVFAFNGIVRADRTPNPALYEVKTQYARIGAQLLGQILLIENKHMFLNLSGFEVLLSKYGDGEPVSKYRLRLPEIRPGDKAGLTLPSALLTAGSSGETTLTADFVTAADSAYAPAGHVALSKQFILRQSAFAVKEAPAAVPEVTEKDGLITVAGPSFSLTLNRADGGISSYKKNGTELLSSAITPNFWRAPIDNDTLPQVPFVAKLLKLRRFKNAMLKLRPKKIKVTEESSAAVIEISWSMPGLISLKTRYSVFGGGDVRIEMRVRSFFNLIRYGFKAALSSGIDGVKFYGRGPHENYTDRKTSANIGLYTGKAESFIHDYLHCQENGNHTDIRYLEIGGREGIRVRASGGKPFEASVHPYSVEMLENAGRANRLGRLPYLHVYIDGGQRGVGGDVPAMALLKKPYKLKRWKEHSFEIYLD